MIIDILALWQAIIFGAALGGVVVFAALYLVGKGGGLLLPDLTDDEWAIVSEQCIRELAFEFTGVGTGGNVEAQLWPARPARRAL